MIRYKLLDIGFAISFISIYFNSIENYYKYIIFLNNIFITKK